MKSELSVDVPAGRENLCVKAAELFFEAAGLDDACVDISLTKRIPLGAGLGGGSSDAAAVLKALNRLFGRPLAMAQLAELAVRLGSDVPFFLCPGACVASGRGEILKPVAIPKLYILLYVPPFAVNTAWAYKETDRLRGSRRSRAELTSRSFSPNIAASRLKAGKLSALGKNLPNSFEEVVFRLHPELGRVKARLLAAGAAVASLSGSGSAVYAIVHPGQRRRIRQELAREGIPLLSTETVNGPWSSGPSALV